MSQKQGPSGNHTIQEKLRQREKLAQKQVLKDLSDVIGTPAGRRFLYDLIFRRCGVMAIYAMQDSGIYRHEGRRGLGIELAQDVQEIFPELYIKMITERLQDQENEQRLRSAAVHEDTRSEDV